MALSITTVARMGAKARNDALKPERRSEIAKIASDAARAAKAACTHQETFTRKRGGPSYCRSCRRKLT